MANKSSKLSQVQNNANGSPFECVALLLQGGGALGAYQAGVYQALSEAGLAPNWVAGISIGAVNAGIIAGNAPEDRIAKLREFWEFVTSDSFKYTPNIFKSMLTRNDEDYQALNYMSALRTIFMGIPGFFQPRLLSPWVQPKGTYAATSFCDNSMFKDTLEKFIDFDRLNNGDVRFNVGAVNVKSGNFTDFDSKTMTITADHIMASGALPPGFPAVEIEGEYYWDGGLVSNTPLQWVVESKSYLDTLVFQVDLWSADGEFPQNMADVLTRQKDIQFSSRTRASTDRFKEQHKLLHTIASLIEKLPKEYQDLPEAKELAALEDHKVYNIVHLIYHNKSYEGYSKDFEFSRLSMEAHWQSGYQDTLDALKHKEVLERPHNNDCIAIYDFSNRDVLQDKIAKAS